MCADYFFITFNGVNGKVARGAVSTTGYHLEARGTAATAFICQDFNDFASISLRARPLRQSNSVGEIPTSQEFLVLGEHPLTLENWFYIKVPAASGEPLFGFILAERTNIKELTFEAFIPEAIQTIAPEPPQNNQNANNNGGVFGGENLFHGGLTGIVLGENMEQGMVDVGQTLRELLAFGTDDAAVHQGEDTGYFADNAPAGGLGAWVNSDDGAG